MNLARRPNWPASRLEGRTFTRSECEVRQMSIPSALTALAIVLLGCLALLVLASHRAVSARASRGLPDSKGSAPRGWKPAVGVPISGHSGENLHARLQHRRLAFHHRPDDGGRRARRRQNYPDPYFGMNLRQIPGPTIHRHDFLRLPMPKDSPYRCGWWYRTEFTRAGRLAR